MKRTEIINSIINKFSYKNYLEIGVHDAVNFNSIRAENKDAVDCGVEGFLPKEVNYKMTSDEFFAEHAKNKTYDFIFIDGLHHTEQVDKDIENSLNHLNENGIIMLHDAIPPSFISQIVPRCCDEWTGDVWKSIIKLRIKNKKIKLFTIDSDYGCCIIQKSKNEDKLKIDFNEQTLTWEFFQKNKYQLLNIITIKQFIEFINE